jgi:excisionase family DNA binding protein
MTESPAVLTVPEAAQLLRLARNTAYAAARRGQIPTVRIGRRILIPRAALERMLEQAAPQPPEPEQPQPLALKLKALDAAELKALDAAELRALAVNPADLLGIDEPKLRKGFPTL